MIRRVLLLLLLGASLGCGSELETCLDTSPEGTLRFEDASTKLPDFFAHPWPSDLRREPDGRLRLASFPNPRASTALEDYKRIISEETRGFGTNSALYASFGAALDIESFPASAAMAAAEDATVQLIDIDAGSPERGRRFPLDLRFSEAATLFLPANHLIAHPPFGFPLRPNSTYALVLSTGLRRADGSALESPRDVHNALREACLARAPSGLAEVFAPLRAHLSDVGRSVAEIAGAAVFTTQDAVGSAREVAAFARELPIPDLRVTFNGRLGDAVTVIQGELELPGLQEGTVPFSRPDQGGRLARDEAGGLRVVRQETTRVTFTWLRRAAPTSGWPVVIYAHGTGGDFEDVLNPSVGAALAAQGLAAVGYDLQLHGPRAPAGTDPALTFFNIANILAARDNFLQGLSDLVVLTRFVQNRHVRATPIETVRLDHTRTGFLGHSQGGLIGTLYAAMEPNLKSAVFSGTAGVLAITLVERKDIVNFRALLETLAGIDGEETLDEVHPLISLFQTFIEPADPINYARLLPVEPPEGRLRDALFIEGLLDDASPARGHEALASAARAPVVEPVARIPAASEILGIAPVRAPVEHNLVLGESRATTGLLQYPEGDHFPLFDYEDAKRRSARFLRTGLIEGKAVIEAP